MMTGAYLFRMGSMGSAEPVDCQKLYHFTSGVNICLYFPKYFGERFSILDKIGKGFGDNEGNSCQISAFS